MHKIGWFEVVRGHARSSAMSPFDRAHTISYSSLIETMRHACTVFEIRQVICRNSPTSTNPTWIWRPHWGWPRSNFEKIFGISKPESLRYRAACGVVCVFLCLAILLEDRHVTDKHRHRRTDTASWHIPREHSSRGKNRPIPKMCVMILTDVHSVYTPYSVRKLLH